MSRLAIFTEQVLLSERQPKTSEYNTEDAAVIAEKLSAIGVRFERWPTRELAADASPEVILTAYADEVARLKRERGFKAADVVSLNPDHPQREALRQKFLDEHVHAEDEVRFFVRGQGLFYLHCGDKVYALRCEQNDLISVPDGARHWFDMGPRPEFTCIRLFTNPEGWVADFTGSDLAAKTPRFEDLVIDLAGSSDLSEER